MLDRVLRTGREEITLLYMRRRDAALAEFERRVEAQRTRRRQERELGEDEDDDLDDLEASCRSYIREHGEDQDRDRRPRSRSDSQDDEEARGEAVAANIRGRRPQPLEPEITVVEDAAVTRRVDFQSVTPAATRGVEGTSTETAVVRAPATPTQQALEAAPPAQASKTAPTTRARPTQQALEAAPPAQASKATPNSQTEALPVPPAKEGKKKKEKKRRRKQRKRDASTTSLTSVMSSSSSLSSSSYTSSSSSSDESSSLSTDTEGKRKRKRKHSRRSASPGPRLQVPEFHGDPLEFGRFVRIFKQAVEKKQRKPEVRFTHLITLCKGEARRRIQHLHASNHPKRAYKEAMKILRKRFGEDRCIADAWMKRLSKGDFGGVVEFGHDLKSALESLTELHYTHLVDSSTFVDLLARRLPRDLREEWDRKAYGKRVDGEVRFKDFVKFVERRGGTSPDLTLGATIKPGSSTANRRIPSSTSKTVKACATCEGDERALASSCWEKEGRSHHTTFATTEGEEGDICGVCGDSHFIGSCPDVRKAAPKRRRDLMGRAGVCFVCLRLGHSARECVRQMWCEVAGCRRRHHTILHLSEAEERATRSPGRGLDGSPKRRRGPRKTRRSPAPETSASSKEGTNRRA